MSPPAIETGELPLTAFWSLFATPRANWFVSAFWTPTWKPPAPPQPATQLGSRSFFPSQPHDLTGSLPLPMFWFSSWSWSVLALFLTSASAVDVAVCEAVLGPEVMSPPAIETGVLPLTAFCLLFAKPSAICLVSAFWTPSWKPPGPPQPA
jgi:hypothetical protein